MTIHPLFGKSLSRGMWCRERPVAFFFGEEFPESQESAGDAHGALHCELRSQSTFLHGPIVPRVTEPKMTLFTSSPDSSGRRSDHH